MVDDRGVGLAGPGRAALPPITGIGEGVLIRPLGYADALDPDGEAGGVHHDEHVGQALIGLTDQFGRRAFEGHDAGRRGMDAELVLDAYGAEAVALAQGSVGHDVEFRGQEQADPLGSRGGVGQAGQHEVDDVVGGVVVAPGDVDLLAIEGIGPVPVRRRRRGQGSEVRTRLRLGQDHGAGPFTGHQPRQIDILLRGRAVRLQRFDRRQRQHGTQAEGHVGGVDGLKGRQFQRLGQLLAADVGRGGQAGPAALGELAIGVGKARCCLYVSVGEGRALLVADPVQRGQHAFRKLRRGLQHRAQQVGVIVGEGPGSRDLVDARDGLEGEGEIANGGLVCHRQSGLVLLGLGTFLTPCRDGTQVGLARTVTWFISVTYTGDLPWQSLAVAIRPFR